MGDDDVGIRLSIEITSPLTPDDKDLLSGVAVMTLAIANHEMAKNAFPDAFGDGDEAGVTATPARCGFTDPKRPDRVCIADEGHGGRHKFRALPN